MDEEEKFNIVCPLCKRKLAMPYDKHHLTPKSKGGRQTVYLHRICHSKIHSVFTRSELANNFFEIENIKKHPEIRKFIRWVSKKPSSFYNKTKKMK